MSNKTISNIKKIKAREILDSRGNPTVEVEMITGMGSFQASVPSGASRGKYEAVELRDGGKRYDGKGVLKAVDNINKIIAPKLIGKDPANQKEIDELMIGLDGTENKLKLGVNAICPVSIAACRAGAAAKNLELWRYISKIAEHGSVSIPKPCFNIINGGAHAENGSDFQEFMVVPQDKSFAKNLQIAAEIYHQLKKIIKNKYGGSDVNVGDEGGFAPQIKLPEEAIKLVLKAAKDLDYEKDVKILLDIAASQFFSSGKYRTKMGIFLKEKLSHYYLDLIGKNPILGLEDPFAEDDWGGWRILNSELENKKPEILVIGDDLLVTNPKKIKEAREKSACNAMILKINQIGTITEALESAKLAKSYGWKVIVSHRSGETCDSFISDFSVGIGADFIKSGAPCRGERTSKYNRLLKISEELEK